MEVFGVEFLFANIRLTFIVFAQCNGNQAVVRIVDSVIDYYF